VEDHLGLGHSLFTRLFLGFPLRSLCLPTDFSSSAKRQLSPSISECLYTSATGFAAWIRASPGTCGCCS
jgi:hypothetical protein